MGRGDLSQASTSDIANIINAVAVLLVALGITWFLFKLGGALSRIIKEEE